ncbi:nucleoporin Nup120/160-domain-containing protein [Xylariaceae sp. FL0804]|nr:nucleoporin Nup120/160-domain-containing protein [Xylariaceae sp. FL0804]
MASREPSFFYKETRLNLEPSSAAFVVDVKLPSPETRRTKPDNNAFRTRNCATESGVYHRVHHNFPKSFLWRVLGGGRILSLRTLDVCKPAKASDTNLILNFHFQNPIKPACVALADPPDHNALSVFVLDAENQLYTLFLRPDSFRKRSFAEAGLGDSCKVYKSKAFGFRKAYRLIAVSNDRLITTLLDGGLLVFNRNKTLTGSQNPWIEAQHSPNRWIRGWNPLRQRSDTDITAGAAAIETSLGLDHASFLLSVCLDHRLRIWNLNNGQILGALDLLNADRDPQETGKWQLDSSQTNLIRLVGKLEGRRLCVTYSPVGSGEFKFWRLDSEDEHSVEVNDTHQETRFIPTPPPGSDVWTLADFGVSESNSAQTYRMWILWKNNMAYRVQELSFTMDDLPEVWEGRWRSVFADTTVSTAPISGPSEPSDATEKWLNLIFAPGRFPKPVLEAALSAYEQATEKSADKRTRNSQDLAESICSAIASNASLGKTSSGELEYEQFRISSESQWRRFYRILLELDKPRGEALALAYAPDSGMPWVVCAGGVSAIRECSAIERIYHNPLARQGGGDDLASLITTGRNFVEGFSDGMLQICEAVLRSELFEETSKTDQERIQYFSDKAGFWRQISDEDCGQVTDILGPNFNAVSTSLYQRMLETCDETWDSQHRGESPLTDFGRNVVVKATQDLAELQWNVCFSQLILLVHMEFEFDRPEDALHNRVNIGPVYRNLLRTLARLTLVRWLANTSVLVPIPRTDRSNSISSASPIASKRQGEEHRLITALESTVGHLLGLPDAPSARSNSMSSAITKLVADLCAPDSGIQLQAQYIQCGLLVRDRADLALDLAPFCRQDPFPTYVQGRVCLALKDFTTAATHFKKASYGMSTSRTDPDRHSSGLLDDTEWNLLYAGLPRYYAHIVALFEKQKAYSYVVDFARLALQFVNSKTEDGDMLRTEVQSRLFSAATAISRFDLAHSTLVAIKDRALQHSCLRALIQKMCDSLHNTELVALSFPGLQNAVDEILAQKCYGTMDVITGVPYHQILYSWRIKRNDYRGAAAVLLDRIQKLRQLGEGDQLTGDDVLDTVITRQYLVLINVLSCVDHKQAWVTTGDLPGQANGAGAAGNRKRKVMTLADIRKEYQDELDRIAAIQNNQFGFAADDEMEIL